MLENGIQPNPHSFSAVINACAKAGDVASATEYLEQMEGAGVPADVVVYSSVLDACGKAGDTDVSRKVFKRMRARGVRPNVVAYASMARPFAHHGDWREVEHLSQQMADDGLVMNEYFLYTLLLAYASARPREATRAEAAFRKSRAEGVPANRHVLAALARATGRARCQELTQELCGRAVRQTRHVSP